MQCPDCEGGFEFTGGGAFARCLRCNKRFAIGSNTIGSNTLTPLTAVPPGGIEGTEQRGAVIRLPRSPTPMSRLLSRVLTLATLGLLCWAGTHAYAVMRAGGVH